MDDVVTNKFIVKLDGETYEGSYKIQNGIIEVGYNGMSKAVVLGDHDPVVVADLLMTEMIKGL